MQSEIFPIDRFKLQHWLNARKCTMTLAADRTGLDESAIRGMLKGEINSIPHTDALKLAWALDVQAHEIHAGNRDFPSLLYQSHAEVYGTKRSTNRGGHHYYNYYTLPTPHGLVAPVLIDIMCPKDRDPVQNNGHLEPAITINLGPGDINGLWGDKSKPDAWGILKANRNSEHQWIVGDSYLEPPYQPHTYSRASDQPAQILSYTVKSNLEEVVYQTNSWSDAAFDNMTARFDSSRPSYAVLLLNQMERRGFTLTALESLLGIGDNAIKAYTEGDVDALDINDLKKIGRFLGVDYRSFMMPDHVYDAVGKTLWTIADSAATIRSFRTYTVASMSIAPQHPDLMGLFIKVDKADEAETLDLTDFSCAHYLVTGGNMTFVWLESEGNIKMQALASGDALWIAPFVAHAFFGNGSLIKMGNGEGLNYLQTIELSNTYNVAETLRRSRKDQTHWGYDTA